MMATPSDGPLMIDDVSAKIGCLERKVAWLTEQLARTDKSDGAKSFMREERSAVVAAIAALRFHRAEVEGVGDVVGALRRLVAAHELGVDTAEAVDDAVDALREWPEV